MKQCCATCGWAKWRRKPSGRIKPHYAGTCEWPQPNVQMPIATCFRVTMYRTHIWPKDGDQCPVWKPLKLTKGEL